MGMFIHRRKVLNAKKVNDQKSVKVEEPKAVEKPTSTLTVKDIEKLPFFTLRSLAVQHGLDTKDKKADQIRKELIQKIREEK